LENKPKTVVVIGAGPAGLTAAFEILKQDKENYRVILLEESNYFGGISRTVQYNGNRMDLGGHRFFSKDQRVMDWWHERMPLQGKPSRDDILTQTEKPLDPDGPDPETTDKVMLFRNRISRIYYLRRFFDYPISLKMQTFINMGLKNTILSGFSYFVSILKKLPETSLENFYINRFGKKLYSMFFENYTEKLWGRHPSRISADWGAQRVKGLSIIRIIADMFGKLLPKFMKENRSVETSLIEKFWYPKLGPGQLWESVADEISEMGGEIHKNCKVINLDLSDGQIRSITCIENGVRQEIAGDIFISSMPIKDLVRGFEGSVPSEMRRIADGLPYREFITVGLQLSSIRLKNQTKIKTPFNRIPDCWIYIQEPDVKMGRLQIFNNWSPYLAKDFEKNISIGLEYFCSETDDLWNMPDDAFIRFAIQELVSMNIIDETAVTDTHIEHVVKAYPAYFDTYEEINSLITWLNTIGNLYCIGRNGQHRYNNSDHSMATAFEAVKNILNQIETRDNIWNINTEKTYHESS
jgi:protoporphyrinogen oxidase